MSEDIIPRLTGIKLFHDMDQQELAIVSEYLEIKNFPEFSTICKEGEIGSEFFIILQGEVKIDKKDSDHKNHEIAVLKRGESFGEMSLIDDLPRSATVTAKDSVKLAILTRISFLTIKASHMEIYSHMLLNLAREFSARLRKMDNKYIKVLDILF